jgi:hypothetical protein
MEIVIRKLKDMEHNYFAYLHGMSGKGTYILYFEDNITGAVCLHNFIEMLKMYWKIDKAEIRIQDKEVEIRHKAVLDVIGGERVQDA